MPKSKKKPPAHEVILDRLRHYGEQTPGANFELRCVAVQELCLILTQMEIPTPVRQKVEDDLRKIWNESVRQSGFHDNGNLLDLLLSDTLQTLHSEA